MARDVDAALGHLPIGKLNALALSALVIRWQQRYSRSAAYTTTSCLRSFLRASEAFGAPVRLDEKIPRPPFQRPRTTIATPEEFSRLLAHAQPWERLFLFLTRQLAMRFTEASNITERCWSRDTHTLTYTHKGGDLYTLPTTPEIEQLLDLAPEADPDEPYIFRLAGRPMKPATIRAAFRRLKKAAHVNPDLIIHDLRRTAAVAAMDTTHDLRLCQQLLGHKSLANTAWYLQHRNPTQLRQLIHQLRPPTEVKQ